VAAGLVVAVRRGHRIAAAGFAVAAFTIAAAVIDASMLPVNADLGLLATNYRWLWAIVTYLVLGTLCFIVFITPRLSGSRGSTVVTGLLATLLLVSAVANIPRSVQVFDPDVYARNQDATRALLGQLESVSFDGPVVIDQDAMYLGHPYTYPILTMLTDRGVDYRFEPPVQARRFGDRRVSDGSEPQRLELVFGDAAEQRRSETTTVAYVEATPPVAASLIDQSPDR